MIKLGLIAAGLAAYVLLNLISLKQFLKHPSGMRSPDKLACTVMAIMATVAGAFVAIQGGLFLWVVLGIWVAIVLRWNYLRRTLREKYHEAYSDVPTYRMEQAEKLYNRTLDWMPEVFIPCTVFAVIAVLYF